MPEAIYCQFELNLFENIDSPLLLASQRYIRPCAVPPAQKSPLRSTAIQDSFSGRTIFNAIWSCNADMNNQSRLPQLWYQTLAYLLKVVHIQDGFVRLRSQHETSSCILRFHKRSAMWSGTSLLEGGERRACLDVMQG